MARLAADTLMDRLAHGDPQALSALYDRYAGIVNALVLEMVPNGENAEQILQVVFLQAWREAQSYDARDGSPMAWLCGMARARALERPSAHSQNENPSSTSTAHPLAAQHRAPTATL